ncbi:SET domain containing [Seminavis robusta]|uniref:SET domain containing n=1 Tax=Seminavis robusta TaxID=568900 RepID=A0A9N8HKF2_9STRA|nr:SET domain containing [Seminavis robusta]|eukprot:Sro752_g197230.1 SET domain containing (498) ;mRNA; r:37737-39230
MHLSMSHSLAGSSSVSCRTVAVTIASAVWLVFNAASVRALSSRTPPFFEGNAQRDLSTLREWATKNGVRFAENVGFSNSGETDGDQADWAISLLDEDVTSTGSTLRKGAVVLSVPQDLVLSSSKVLDELGGISALQSAFDFLEEESFGDFKSEFLLVLKMLKELSKGGESKWCPWIQSLPKHFSTGISFDNAEIECLPTFSAVLVEYECLKLQAFGVATSKLDHKWIPDIATSDGMVILKWAYNVVYSRCWKFSDYLEESDGGDSDIVPIGDLFNHKEPANVAVENEPSSGSVDFVLQNSDTGTAVGANKINSLCLSYGTSNPHRFLVIFGFVDESMPEIFSQITFPNPTADHIALGCEDRSKMVYGTTDGCISNDTIRNSVLFALLVSKPEEQKAFVEAHRQQKQSVMRDFHSKYALETALTLKNHVSATLAELELLGNRIEEVKREDTQQRQHSNLPLIEKHNQFLRRVFGKVKKRLDAAVEEETLRRRTAFANQ